MTTDNYEYDVAISYASEDEEVAKALANTLKKKGIRVHFDKFERSKIWGQDLLAYLLKIYAEKSIYCILIISKNYPLKKWTRYEFKCARYRQRKQTIEYLLPIRLDDTVIRGLPSTIAYLDWRVETIESICETFAEKLQSRKVQEEKVEIAPRPIRAEKINGMPVISNEPRLEKIEDRKLSDIIDIKENIISFDKIRSSHEGNSGCYISLNRGKRIFRIGAYENADTYRIKWVSADQLNQADAVSSSISGRVSGWLAVGKLWIRYGNNRDDISLDLPTNEEFTKMALLGDPPRVVITTKNFMYLYNYQTKTLLSKCEVPNNYTGYSFDNMWFSDQGYLVTGKYASQVIWENSSLRKTFDFNDLGLTAHYVSHANTFDPKGLFFSCIGMPQHLVVIDMKDSRVISNIALPGNGVNVGRDLVFHPAYSNLLFCVNASGEISCWNAINNSIRILAVEKRKWTTCFFSGVNILTTIDEIGLCTTWRVIFLT